MDFDEFVEKICEALNINRDLECVEEYDLQQIYTDVYSEGYSAGTCSSEFDDYDNYNCDDDYNGDKFLN